MEYFDPHRFLVSTMGVIVSLVFFIFFHVLKLTDSLLLLLYVCAIVSFWFGPLLWKLAPFFVFSHQKFKTLVHPSTEKVIWNTLYVAQQKWTCHIYLEAHKSQEISKDNGLKSHLLAIKISPLSSKNNRPYHCWYHHSNTHCQMKKEYTYIYIYNINGVVM